MSVDPAGTSSWEGRTPESTGGARTPASTSMASAAHRADVLLEALPYIQRFRGAVVVIKHGGNAMTDAALGRAVADDVVLLRAVGLKPLVVHGGGPQISDLMSKLGKRPEFRDGLRVTDAETVEIARMVLVGKVNRDIVSAINIHGPLAVGLSGEDAGLLLAGARNPELGFVGDVTAVNADILEKLLAEDLIPVVSTIGSGPDGQPYNINADTVAGALAEAVRAEKVVFLTDVAGLLTDVEDPASLVSRITASELDALIAGGRLEGGMLPKITAALHAVRHGVASAHLLDGRIPHVVLVELFSDAGIGTMITNDDTGGDQSPSDPDQHPHGRLTQVSSNHLSGSSPSEPAAGTATSAGAHPDAMAAPRDLERCPLMPTYAAPPVQFVRGEGSWLWDRTGKRYLDLLSGLGVTSLGHSHPQVAAALAEQARTLLHVSNLFGNDIAWEVATTLDRLIGDGAPAGGQVFFANSGAEANECALKLARRFGGHGRYVVVSAYGSFHGRTLATLHATGQPTKHEPFQPLPAGFRHVAWHDLDALEAALDPTVAAVLLEPIQGEGGVNPATPAYFHGVRRLCDERGVLLMVDEVQTGLGRTGRWFGFQNLGVMPDVVTMAKALGNGVPIGACWARAEVARAFEAGDHATTFGGQPLATAGAKATLAVMEAEDVPARAQRAGQRLAEALSGIDGVKAVRGMGLLLAVELDGQDARQVTARLLDEGVVVNAVTPTALRLAPSLLITDDELDQGVAAIGQAVRP
jgi:acetylornithine/N-succinyldiaminopimelate aminotransferase